MTLDLYRIYGFEDMVAMITQNPSTAILMTGGSEQYAVMGTLTFGYNGIDLEILDSDCAYLPVGTQIHFG